MAGLRETARLIDPTALRAMWLALRGDLERFQPPPSPDTVLVDVLVEPFDSVPDAAERLEGLEAHLRERGDRRAVFLTIYTRMTREVHDGIAAGTFADPAWLADYLVTFANYYRRAFLAFERGDIEAVADPWRIAFGASYAGDALVIQDAFLAVNAHITYDLALTLADVGLDPDRAEKYADHRAINRILARLVDAQQEALAEVYAAGVADVDAVFRRVDETLTLRSMTEAREYAWRVAVALTDGRLAPVPAAVRWVHHATATGAALFVLGRGLDPAVVETMRTVEAGGLDLETVLEFVDDRLDERA